MLSARCVNMLPWVDHHDNEPSCSYLFEHQFQSIPLQPTFLSPTNLLPTTSLFNIPFFVSSLNPLRFLACMFVTPLALALRKWEGVCSVLS